MKKKYLLFVLLNLLSASLFAQSTNQVYQFQKAKVTITKDKIIASTGKIERTWQFTGNGLQTTSLKNITNGKEYARQKPIFKCDWDLPGALTDTSTAEWVTSTVTESDDEGFSNRHLEIISEFKYPDAKLMVQHVIWLYPNAVGIRTQLRIKGLEGFSAENIRDDESREKRRGNWMAVPGPRNEYLPLNYQTENQRRYWGYYNNPSGRHDPNHLMLEEKVLKGYPVFQTEDNDWASGISIEYHKGNDGVCVVKESPKAVNQKAHYTGGFYSDPTGLSVTGWGLSAKEILTERYRECWAVWTILWEGGNDGMQLALKKFDRVRYPVFPERDLFLMSNTWGPAKPNGQQYADEDYLLKEIPALADLGIEVMQIDDGWQKDNIGPYAKDFTPKYKDGWKNIKAEGDKFNLRYGLWTTAKYVTIEELKKNIDALGFVSWKVDFDFLESRSDYENRIKKYRAAMEYAPMKTQFSLCPEYDDPRYGWYYCKEYGSIYFQNQMESLPAHGTMVPYQTLMQHWVMTKYFNANKLQVMLQNPKRVNPERSDAPQYSHAYCFALGIPFVPVFFQSAQFLDPEGKKELKTLFDTYKKNREGIFTGYTFPIGEQPDNETWSGFQMLSEYGIKNNYLLIFREIHNQEINKKIQLKFLKDKTIKVSNLRTGKTELKKVDANGYASFAITNPADFLMLKYEVLK